MIKGKTANDYRQTKWNNPPAAKPGPPPEKEPSPYPKHVKNYNGEVCIVNSAEEEALRTSKNHRVRAKE